MAMYWDDDLAPGESGFWQEPDFLLADLVSSFVNKGGMQLGITLFLKGMIITGTLVSEADYLAAMSRMFARQARRSMPRMSKEEQKAAEELFDFTGLSEDEPPPDLRSADPHPGGASAAAAASPDTNADENDGSFDPDDLDDFDFNEETRPFPTIRHMHLKDPVILQPQPSISFLHNQLPIMRIRLAEVDGWMIGKVALDDDSMDDFPSPPNHEIRH